MSFFLLSPVPAFIFYDTFVQSSGSGKIIVLILLVSSIWVWTVIASKLLEMYRARKNSEEFIAEYRKAPHPAALYRGHRSGQISSPLEVIYNNACAALGASLEASAEDADHLFIAGATAIKPNEIQVNAARCAADRTVADQALLLEKQMGLLAIASSTAPFLGLLGTVIGVMESFGNMGSSGAALLSDVAPGISAALLTTVVGLVVALPSSIGYNILGDKIRQLTVLMDNFAQELISDLEHMKISE